MTVLSYIKTVNASLLLINPRREARVSGSNSVQGLKSKDVISFKSSVVVMVILGRAFV